MKDPLRLFVCAMRPLSIAETIQIISEDNIKYHQHFLFQHFILISNLHVFSAKSVSFFTTQQPATIKKFLSIIYSKLIHQGMMNIRFVANPAEKKISTQSPLYGKWNYCLEYSIKALIASSSYLVMFIRNVLNTFVFSLFFHNYL